MKRTPMAGIDLPGNLPLAWEALAARDAEIELLKARISTLEGAMRADEGRLVEAAKLSGVGYFGCDTPEVMADTIGGLREQLRLANADAAENEADANDLSAEIERLKALVEKRERQLVWALRACGDDEALKFYGLDIIAMSDDDAGLLAAIDEAMQETSDPK